MYNSKYNSACTFQPATKNHTSLPIHIALVPYLAHHHCAAHASVHFTLSTQCVHS